MPFEFDQFECGSTGDCPIRNDYNPEGYVEWKGTSKGGKYVCFHKMANEEGNFLPTCCPLTAQLTEQRLQREALEKLLVLFNPQDI